MGWPRFTKRSVASSSVARRPFCAANAPSQARRRAKTPTECVIERPRRGCSSMGSPRFTKWSSGPFRAANARARARGWAKTPAACYKSALTMSGCSSMSLERLDEAQQNGPVDRFARPTPRAWASGRAKTPAVCYKSALTVSGCSSMVERQLPKLHTWVRFPSPAPISPKIRLSKWHSRPGRSPWARGVRRFRRSTGPAHPLRGPRLTLPFSVNCRRADCKRCNRPSNCRHSRRR